MDIIYDLIEILLITATIVVAAVPEGIPYAISISTIFAIKKLQKENLLIKNMIGLEKLSGVTDICTSKAPLTTSDIKVESVYTGGKIYKSLLSYEKNDETIPSETLKKQVAFSVIFNSEVTTDVHDYKKEFFSNGSPLEVALL